MSEIKTTRVLPRWRRTDQPDAAIVGDMPEVGGASDLPPRIPTRVIPRDGTSGLSFDSLSDILQSIQHTIAAIAQEVVFGLDPSFSDLRKIGKDLLQFARLHAEPFEHGSFVIHAELDDTEAIFEGKSVSTREIVTRYAAVMKGIAKDGPHFETSLAVLQSIEEMDKVLKRDVERIELAPSASPEHEVESRPIKIDAGYVLDVSSARRERRRKRIEFRTIEGSLRAVDTVRLRLKLELDGGLIVPGEYDVALETKMAASLRKRVRLAGDVAYFEDEPKYIKAIKIEEENLALPLL